VKDVPLWVPLVIHSHPDLLVGKNYCWKGEWWLLEEGLAKPGEEGLYQVDEFSLALLERRMGRESGKEQFPVVCSPGKSTHTTAKLRIYDNRPHHPS